MKTPDGPVCSRCGSWMLPYGSHVDAPDACQTCDMISPVIVPPYALVTPPSLEELTAPEGDQ